MLQMRKKKQQQTNDNNNNCTIIVGSGDTLIDWVESADDCVYIQIVFCFFSGDINIEI